MHTIVILALNRIKRGSLVRSDNAVETFKRHGEYEESATQTRHPGYCNGNSTVQELIFLGSLYCVCLLNIH